MAIEHCAVIYFENIVEVGYIRQYKTSRVDFDDGSFCNMFYSGAFTIKNLPTPYQVWESYPDIMVQWYNGTGGSNFDQDTYMFNMTV